MKNMQNPPAQNSELDQHKIDSPSFNPIILQNQKYLKLAGLLLLLILVGFLVSFQFGSQISELYMSGVARFCARSEKDGKANTQPAPTAPSQDPTVAQRPSFKLVFKHIPETRQGKVDPEEILYYGPLFNIDVVERWEEFVYYPVGKSLYSLNLITGEKAKIFQIPEDSEYYFAKMQLISEEIPTEYQALYFSLRFWDQPSRLFVLENPTAQPQEIRVNQKFGALKVEKIDGNYWAVGVFGDGCGGNTSYALLDVQTNQATPVFQSHEGCSEGPQKIDIRNGKIYYFSKEMEPDDYYGYYIQDLSSIDYLEPDKETVLISEEDMPPRVISARYAQYLDKLILLSKDSVYGFDLTNNRLEKIADYSGLADQELRIFESEKTICVNEIDDVESNVCIKDGAEGFTSVKNCEVCSSVRQTPNNLPFDDKKSSQQQLEQLKDKLYLPEEYRLILVEELGA